MIHTSKDKTGSRMKGMQKSITMKEQEQRNKFDRLCLILHNAQFVSGENVVYSYPVSVNDYSTDLDAIAVRPHRIIASVELKQIVDEFYTCFLDKAGKLVIS